MLIQAKPMLPPRNSRQPAPASSKSNNQQSNSNQQPIVNPLDPIESSDTDSEGEAEESNDRGRNDGTLLASDPPKPL